MPCYPYLTDEQRYDVEITQRSATKTLLNIKKKFGDDVPSYEERLVELEMEGLGERTTSRLNDYAVKIEFQPWCAQFFDRKNPTEVG